MKRERHSKEERKKEEAAAPKKQAKASIQQNAEPEKVSPNKDNETMQKGVSADNNNGMIALQAIEKQQPAEVQKDLLMTSPGEKMHLPPLMATVAESEALDKLPLNDPELAKDVMSRSPLETLFPAYMMSPLSLGASKFSYGSPQAQSAIRMPFAAAGNVSASNCNQVLGSPLNCPPTFGAYMDFAGLSGLTPCNNAGNNLKLSNSVFGSGNCSPCFAGFSSTSAIPHVDLGFKSEDNKDN